MTDARLPGRWLTDMRFDQLSDRAHRTFTNSLMFSAEQGTDGALAATSLRFLHPLGVDAETRAELLGCGLWLEAPNGGVQVAKWEETQSTAASVAERRRQKREYQTRYRERQKGASDQKSWNSTENSTSTSKGLGKAPLLDSSNQGGAPRPLDAHVEFHADNDESTAPARYCPEHPNGTSRNCWACKEARERREEWERLRAQQQRSRVRDLPIDPRSGAAIPVHEHEWLSDGTCKRPGCTEQRGAA
jgi:hypothetical protein